MSRQTGKIFDPDGKIRGYFRLYNSDESGDQDKQPDKNQEPSPEGKPDKLKESPDHR